MGVRRKPLNQKQKEALKLFLSHEEINRRHVMERFPETKRGMACHLLKTLQDQGYIDIHYYGSGTYYTITPSGEAKLLEITST